MHGGPKPTGTSAPLDRPPEGDGRAVRAARERAKHHRRILRAARDLFTDPEGDDPKVSDIAQAAACSTATIHNHFPNAVPDILGAITFELMNAAFDRYKTTAAELSGLDLPRAYVEAVSDEFYKAGTLTARIVGASVELARHGRWLDDPGMSLLAGCFADAGKTEELPGTPDDLARLTHLLLQGALYSWSLRSLTDDEYLYWAGQSADLAIKARRCTQ